MPEVTSDEIGRRKFQIQKEKSVETAIEKIRQRLGPEWRYFSPEDVDMLKYILGEAWVSIDRKTWEKYAFTRLTGKDIDRMIRIGREVKNSEKPESAAIDEISAMLYNSI